MSPRDYDATPTDPRAGRPGYVPSGSPRPLPREVARPFTYGVRETNPTSQECPDSVSGHDPSGTRDGTCVWCGAQVDSRPGAPRMGSSYRTELDLEYRRVYDPDWGTDPLDV